MEACWGFTASPRKGPTITSPTWPTSCPLAAHAAARSGGRAWVWVGAAAAGLGLYGPIEAAHLRAVLDGRHPTSGTRLRSDRATVLGFDLTFSAPKSVSVVFALGGEEAARQVLAAHRSGVRGALEYVESHALSAQRGAGEQREIVPTTGLVAASFTHGVNRNLDPHLHTHVVMANMVHGPDSRWSACDHRGLSAHRGAASAVYESHVRAELSRRIGVQWVDAPGLRAEIRGVSPLLLGEFSSRSADIRRHMAAWGSHSARGARVAWAATRPEKQSGLNFADADIRMGRARPVGGHRSRRNGCAPCCTSQSGARTGASINEHRFGATLSLAPDGAARRRDVVAAFSTGASRAPTSGASNGSPICGRPHAQAEPSSAWAKTRTRSGRWSPVVICWLRSDRGP